MGLFKCRSKSKNRDCTPNSKSKKSKSLCCCKQSTEGKCGLKCVPYTCSGRNRSCCRASTSCRQCTPCRPSTPCRSSTPSRPSTPCTPNKCIRPACSCCNCNSKDKKSKKESKKESNVKPSCSRIGCSERMLCVSCCRNGPDKTKHSTICTKCKKGDCKCKVKKAKKSK